MPNRSPTRPRKAGLALREVAQALGTSPRTVIRMREENPAPWVREAPPYRASARVYQWRLPVDALPVLRAQLAARRALQAAALDKARAVEMQRRAQVRMARLAA